MPVTIRIMNELLDNPEGGDKIKVPYQYIVRDDGRHLTFKAFSVADYADAPAALAAAKVFKESLDENPWISPFVTHRHILLADYGGAQRIARMALSLYNGNAFPFDAGQLGGLDDKHFEIAIELLRSYHQFGENDTGFMETCDQIKKSWGIGQYATEPNEDDVPLD